MYFGLSGRLFFSVEALSTASEDSVTKSDGDATSSPLTARLESTTKLVKSGNLDSRVLNEFRNAIDHIRNTTWVVQQWIAREQSSDPYTILPTLVTQRMRRATQLASDLSLDLQAAEVTVETEGMSDLYNAVDDLNRRLALLLKRDR
jgi:hypothetical protein